MGTEPRAPDSPWVADFFSDVDQSVTLSYFEPTGKKRYVHISVERDDIFFGLRNSWRIRVRHHWPGLAKPGWEHGESSGFSLREFSVNRANSAFSNICKLVSETIKHSGSFEKPEIRETCDFQDCDDPASIYRAFRKITNSGRALGLCLKHGEVMSDDA